MAYMLEQVRASSCMLTTLLRQRHQSPGTKKLTLTRGHKPRRKCQSIPVELRTGASFPVQPAIGMSLETSGRSLAAGVSLEAAIGRWKELAPAMGGAGGDGLGVSRACIARGPAVEWGRAKAAGRDLCTAGSLTIL